MKLYVGTSGWSWKTWRGVIYPEKLPSSEWLIEYTNHFEIVEINSTFYGLPKTEYVQRWADVTPDNFKFAFKASKRATHEKELLDVKENIAPLMERMQPILEAGKAGPMLWQLPPGASKDLKRLERALKELPERVRHAFEFRHPSWFCPPVYNLLKEYSVALVIAHHPYRPYQSKEITADFLYLRFHQPIGGYEIDELRKVVNFSKEQNLDTFAFFNNRQEQFAPVDAKNLLLALEEKE